MDHADRLTRYLAGERRFDFGRTLRSLPASIDAALAARVVIDLLDRPAALAACKQLPIPVIDAVLAAPTATAGHVFLRLAVPGELAPADKLARWQAALQVLQDLATRYAWGSKWKRTKLAAVARDPIMLPAIQGAVATSQAAPIAMLAVLVADGSDTSYDALVAHIDAAFQAGDHRLDLLRRLDTHAARTPALDALFAELRSTLDARNAACPALALGPLIGIGTLRNLWFEVSLASWRTHLATLPWAYGKISVDSRASPWFDVRLFTADPAASTRFTDDRVVFDELGVGRCEVTELPRWLARVAATLDIAWKQLVISKSNLRGAKPAQLAEWLAAR